MFFLLLHHHYPPSSPSSSSSSTSPPSPPPRLFLIASLSLSLGQVVCLPFCLSVSRYRLFFFLSFWVRFPVDARKDPFYDYRNLQAGLSIMDLSTGLYALRRNDHFPPALLLTSSPVNPLPPPPTSYTDHHPRCIALYRVCQHSTCSPKCVPQKLTKTGSQEVQVRISVSTTHSSETYCQASLANISPGKPLLNVRQSTAL